LYHARSSLEDDKGNISDQDKKTARAEIKKAEEWLESNASADADEISEIQKELEAVLAPIFSSVYKNSKTQAEDGHDINSDDSI
jgi:molecular chaperone DnaK (HSP70)